MEDLQGNGSTTSHCTVPPTFHSASGVVERGRVGCRSSVAGDLTALTRRRVGFEEFGGVRTRPSRHVERGNAGVDEARSVHGHPVGNWCGFRRHGDARSFGDFAVAATAACHCENKSRDCQTRHRVTYLHCLLLVGAVAFTSSTIASHQLRGMRLSINVGNALNVRRRLGLPNYSAVERGAAAATDCTCHRSSMRPYRHTSRAISQVATKSPTMMKPIAPRSKFPMVPRNPS